MRKYKTTHRKLNKEIKQVIHKEDRIMEALNNLNAAVEALKAQVDLIVTAIANNANQNPAIQAAADAVNAETEKLKNALPTSNT